MRSDSDGTQDDRSTETLMEKVASLTATNDRLLTDITTMMDRWKALRAQLPPAEVQAAALARMPVQERIEIMAELKELDQELCQLEDQKAERHPQGRSLLGRPWRPRV